ncbi:MAG: hypothetical protein Q4G03_06405 [Planctomycetia bacterium]|nr:hypothetical protein [Planctomycetia bacterium]
MNKRFSFGRSLSYFVALSLICGLGTLGCNPSREIQIDDDDAVEIQDDKDAYADTVKRFNERLKLNQSRTGVVMSGAPAMAGTTGATASFNFVGSGTTGAAPSFNFNAAATTGDAPVFNFNSAAAATTGAAPSFAFSTPAKKVETPSSFSPNATAAGAVALNPSSFDFGDFVKEQAALKAAAEQASAAADAALLALKAAAEKVTTLTKENEAARANVQNLTQIVQERQSATNDAQQKYEAQDKEVQARAQAVAANTETEKNAKDAVAKQTDAKNVANANLTSATEQRDAVQEQAQVAAAALAKAQDGAAAAQQALTACATKLADAQKVYDAAKNAADAAAATVQQAQAAVEEATRVAADADAALAAAREKLAAAEADENLDDEAKDAARQDVAKAEEAKNAADERIATAQTSLAQAKDAQGNADAKVAQLKTALDAANTAQTNAQTADADAKKAVETAQAEVKRLEGEVAAKVDAVAKADAAAQAAGAELDKQVAALAQTSSALEDSQNALAQAKQLATELKKAWDDTKPLLVEAQEQLTNAQKNAETLSEALTDAQAALTKANDAAQQARVQADEAAKKVFPRVSSTEKHNFFFAELENVYSAQAQEERLPSAENLVSAIDSLCEALKRDVDDMKMIPSFDDGAVAVRRDANALAVVALALGVSKEDAPLKSVAKELVEIASTIASAGNAEEIEAAVKALDALKPGAKVDDQLQWHEVASLQPLMKYAVPSLSTDIKRLGRNEKTFLRGNNAKKVVDASTILVAIALGCRENVDQTLAPKEDALWREYCERLATAALDFNACANDVAAGKGDFDAMKDAFKVVESTCNSTCHEKFGGKTSD